MSHFPITAVVDICIVVLMLSMVWFALRRNKGNPVSLGRKARFLPLFGFGLIAAFHLADFTVAVTLPGLLSGGGWISSLHFYGTWPLVFAAVPLIGAGYICSVRETAEAIAYLEAARREAQTERLRMSDFAASASDWFWETDEALRYSWFSPNVEAITGMTREQLCGKARKEFPAPVESNVPWKTHLETLERREPFKDIVYKQRVPGGYRWLRTTGVPVFDGDGRFTGYRGTGSDVTREVEAKIASNEAKTLLARAVESMNEMFVLWGPDDRLVLCNDKFREINAAVPKAAEPGTLFADHVRAMLDVGGYPEAAGREDAWFKERLERHRHPQGPCELARQDGIWVLFEEQKLADGSTVTISLDITQRKKAEIALQENEALLESIIENVPLGLLIKNADHIVERVNDTYLGWYGLEPKALVGRCSEEVENFQSGRDAVFMNEQEAEVLQTGRIRTRQVERVFADGDTHTVEITKFPVRDRHGKIIKVGSVSVDLTEQIRTQKALTRSEMRFRDFAETASDWSWEMDDQLRFTDVSDRYRVITGFEPAFYQGKTRREMASEEVNDEKWHRHYSDLDNRRPFRDFRYNVTRADGTELTISISGKPVFDEDGRFQGYRGTGTNITEQRRIEKARDAAMREALDANAAKSKFLANMSHDLRTPLNAILGFSDILRAELLGPLGVEKYREYAGDIHASASYLLELVNDLLDISTIEAGKVSLAKETFCVRELIDDCVHTFIGKAYSKDVQLVTKVPNDLPPLYADKRATRQILLNLLTNAVKFTPSGGQVSAIARIADQNTEIIVKDTGSGIPPERLAEVVNPFSRGEHDPYETDAGWGLGLSIAHSLVGLHCGSMNIKSRPGCGTTVTVILPNELVSRAAS